MKIVTNSSLIERNKKIGRYTTIASIVIIVAGVYIVFTYPDRILLSYILLIVGFLVTQISIYFGSRWGRSPRPDEHLTSALKGLDDRYTLYHYSSPIHHLLIGPAGIWALLPYSQPGSISYDEKRNRWRQGGTSAFMKFFGQEGIGRPDADVRDSLAELNKMMTSLSTQGHIPEPQAVLVFTNDKAKIDATGSPYPAMPAEKLKEFLRKRVKEAAVSPEVTTLIEKSLPAAAKD